MTDLAVEIQAYAAYLNGHRTAREQLRHEELEEYEQDMAKAQASMEAAYWTASVALC